MRGLWYISLFFICILIVVFSWGWFSPSFREQTLPLALGATFLYWLIACVLYGAGWLAIRRTAAFFLSVVSIVITLVVIEVVARLVAPGHAVMRFRWLDSREYHHVAPANGRLVRYPDIVVITNEDSLRTEYSREDFRSHENRIAMLGDSFTWGFNMEQPLGVVSQVESILREDGVPDVAVLNAGIVSYSPFLGRLQWEGIVRHYEPEVVLYLLDATDFGDDISYERQAVKDATGYHFDLKTRKPFYAGVVFDNLWHFYWRAKGAPLKDIATLPWNFVRDDVLGFPPREDYYRFHVIVDGQHEYSRYFIYKHSQKSLAPFLNATVGNINALAAGVKEQGAHFVLVVLPRFHHWNNAESPGYWETGEYGVDEPFEYAYLDYFDDIAETLPYPVLNLLPAFQATDRFPLCFQEDAHWNADGNRFAAEVIGQYLIEHGLTGVDSSE